MPGIKNEMPLATGTRGAIRVARSPAPHYLHTTQDQAHSRLTSAITAPQTPRLRPPAAGDYAAQPLTGTRHAALLGRLLKKSWITQ
jgi:hypothetical protein